MCTTTCETSCVHIQEAILWITSVPQQSPCACKICSYPPPNHPIESVKWQVGFQPAGIYNTCKSYSCIMIAWYFLSSMWHLRSWPMSRMMATPAKTHLAAGCFVRSCATKTKWGLVPGTKSQKRYFAQNALENIKNEQKKTNANNKMIVRYRNTVRAIHHLFETRDVNRFQQIVPSRTVKLRIQRGTFG